MEKTTVASNYYIKNMANNILQLKTSSVIINKLIERLTIEASKLEADLSDHNFMTKASFEKESSDTNSTQTKDTLIESINNIHTYVQSIKTELLSINLGIAELEDKQHSALNLKMDFRVFSDLIDSDAARFKNEEVDEVLDFGSDLKQEPNIQSEIDDDETDYGKFSPVTADSNCDVELDLSDERNRGYESLGKETNARSTILMDAGLTKKNRKLRKAATVILKDVFREDIKSKRPGKQLRNDTDITSSSEKPIPIEDNKKVKQKPAPVRNLRSGRKVNYSEEIDNGLSVKKLKSKMNLIHVNKPFVCNNCNQIFSSLKTLKTHRRNNCKIDVDFDTGFSCDVCGNLFNSMNRMLVHRKHHKPQGEYECPVCCIISASLQSHKLHMQTHSGDIYICDLPGCSKTFKNIGKLSQHYMLKSHTECKLLQCHKCKKLFMLNEQDKYGEHLKIHRTEHALKDGKYTCKTCNRCFSTMKYLKVHETCHTGRTPYSCTKCDKKFPHPSFLVSHMRQHTVNLSCEVCGQMFYKAYNLKRHLKTHGDERTVPCPTCGKMFRSQSNMKTHFNKHFNIRPYICDYCGKAFPENSILKRHSRIHTGEKPFACDLCPMKFNQRSSMKSHRRIHTGEMPYKCSVCDNSFRQRPSLISHMKSLHSDVNFPILKRIQYFPVNDVADEVLLK